MFFFGGFGPEKRVEDEANDERRTQTGRMSITSASSPPIGKTIAPAAPSPLFVYALLFAIAAGAFCLAGLTQGRLGAGTHALAVLGGATCGWSWLLTRALFRPAEADAGLARFWPPALVLALVAANALLRVGGGWTTSDAARIVLNAESLVSSALLLLAVVEPLRGISAATPADERRFRALYSGGYAALVAVAVVAANGSAQAGAIKTTCAALALGGMALAIARRRRHPLPQTPVKTDAAPRLPRQTRDDPEQRELARRIHALMQQRKMFTEADLRVADLAERLGAPEYKVSQCVNGALGFRNFNQMINHHRIAEAKRLLGDPACDRLPVLTIALDSGFGSIGPFNRAFKAETGMTPVAFRQASRVGREWPGRDANRQTGA